MVAVTKCSRARAATITQLVLECFKPKGLEHFSFIQKKVRGGKNMYILANGKLITRDEAVPYLPDGGVAIDGTKIAAVDRKSVV